VLSLFSIVGGLGGALAGPLAERLGARRAAVLGLLCMAAASALGAQAGTARMLLASRALEGLGFVITVVAIPSLLLGASAERDRYFVPSLWGVYVPVGTAIALALSPQILRAGSWRTLWQLNAGLLLLLALLLAATTPPARLHRSAVWLSPRALLGVLGSGGPLLLAGIFACYTFQYLPVMGFLPSILEQQGYAAQRAGTLAALAVLANAVGNLGASALIARGIAPSRLIGVGCVVMALSASGLYSPLLGAAWRLALVFAFLGFAGLIPASIFALVPRVAAARGAGASIMGLVVQASHAGQLLGPPAVAALAAVSAGWQYSPLALLPAAAAALLGATRLGRLERGGR
jgi:cyanate permease